METLVQPFSGSLMEFRLWSEPLSRSVFDNHITQAIMETQHHQH